MTTPLEQIAAIVHRDSGIVVGPSQFGALTSAVERVDPSRDLAGHARILSDPVGGASHLARLLDELTVKETFFMREPEALKVIPWRTLFDRARQHRRGVARIWSVGCATGEEAYTLALLASEAAPGAKPPVEILATDISERALAQARAGEYRAYATRELDAVLRRRYLEESDGQLRVSGALRSLVRFAAHNVVGDPVPPVGYARFDVIVCRNILIYFDMATAARVRARLEGALAPSGTLIFGVADLLGAVVQARPRKTDTATRARAARRSEPRRERRSEPRPEAAHSQPYEPIGDSGEPADVIVSAARVLASEPLNAHAHFLDGLAKLAAGDAEAAVVALRKTRYVEPHCGPAAFALGRAYESIGDSPAARRSYWQAVRECLQPATTPPRVDIGQLDLRDVAAAAQARLDALTLADG